MKIGIVANCHVEPITQMLRMLPDVSSVIAVPVNLYGTETFKRASAIFDEFKEDPDGVILTFSVGPRFGDLETSALKKSSRADVVTIPNIYFSGLHPDITYMGNQGKRLKSPIGDYHSKLILQSYFADDAEETCLARFNAQTFQSAGYFKEFSRSVSELYKRDQHLDIKFADEFLAIVYEMPCLYTVNHPTSLLFHAYVHSIAKFLGLRFSSFPVEMLPNNLASGAWWPIYEEIANAHKLKYRTPFAFKQSEELGGKVYDLEQFVYASYHLYRRLGKKQLEKCRQTQQIKLSYTN